MIPGFANGSPISAATIGRCRPADVLAFIQGEQAKWAPIAQEITSTQTHNK